MKKETYQISEAEKLTGEKAHVLRYWEEELGLSIGRNAMGHRVYTAADIQIFLSIKELKKKGLHLKAIRELLPKLWQAVGQTAAEEEIPVSGELAVTVPAVLISEAEKSADQEEISHSAIEGQGSEAMEETIPVICMPADGEETETDQRRERFYEILERLMRQMMLKQRQEERYKRVDEAIRRHQQSRREAAATTEQTGRKRKKGR